MKIEGNGPLSPQELRAIQEKSLEILVYSRSSARNTACCSTFAAAAALGLSAIRGSSPGTMTSMCSCPGRTMSA